MYSLLKKAIFTQDAEATHDATIALLKHTQRTPLSNLYRQCVPDKPVEVFGLTFPNPVGLAAGLDKNGECVDAFAAMGFGFVEIGTVTPKPQAGNDKPRLFRIKDAEGIINRMGFNNHGVDYLLHQVAQSRFKGVLGINIGKNKTTPEEQALDDYLIGLRKVYSAASYVTVNISSPNTPGLRALQYGEALENLLTGLKAEQQVLEQKHSKKVPLLVKIAPDLEDDEIQGIADSLRKSGVEGVIATNTTISRDNITGLQHAKEAGGLSGAPLREKSLVVTEKLAKALAGELPIVAVGGIDSAEAAQARLDAGASLVQLYSGLIYHGPGLAAKVIRGLR